MDRVCLGSSIVDEKEVNHYVDSQNWVCKRIGQYRDALFLISNKGVPRHCTTSTKRGDTTEFYEPPRTCL
jgi:hypothetical protein